MARRRGNESVCPLRQQGRQVLAQISQFGDLAIELFKAFRNQAVDALTWDAAAIPQPVRRRQFIDRESDAKRALNKLNAIHGLRRIASISSRRPGRRR